MCIVLKEREKERERGGFIAGFILKFKSKVYQKEGRESQSERVRVEGRKREDTQFELKFDPT